MKLVFIGASVSTYAGYLCWDNYSAWNLFIPAVLAILAIIEAIEGKK